MTTQRYPLSWQSGSPRRMRERPKQSTIPWEALATVKIIELLGQGVDLRGSDYDWDAKCWRVQDHES